MTPRAVYDRLSHEAVPRSISDIFGSRMRQEREGTGMVKVECLSVAAIMRLSGSNEKGASWYEAEIQRVLTYILPS